MKHLKQWWQNSRILSYGEVFYDAWRNRATWGENKRNEQELDFLPAALEVLERPPSPATKWLGRTLIALVSIAIIWACIGNVDITAMAEGKIISSSRIKDIQPLEKGVVKTIYVSEGQSVKAGDPLVELDQTVTAADQTRLSQELSFTRLNYLRESAFLKALQKKAEKPVFKAEGLTLAVTHTLSQKQLLQQQWLDYQSRINTVKSQKKEREATLEANNAQIDQLKQTLPLITRRTKALKELVDKKLAPEMDYLELEQNRIEQQQLLAVYQAQQNQYIAAIETAGQQLKTLEAEVIRQALTQVDEYRRQVQSLTQELEKATDINAKQTLYAPVDGRVQQLAVHTIGGVVTEAQVLMKLVPQNDYLEVEAVLENKDIGFVFEGQKAEIKVNTFNFTKYGVINAEVIGVTSDAIVDEVKGLVYTLRLKLDEKQMKIDGRMVNLLPGMSVMAEVKTGRRKLIEFVLSPLLRKVDESASER